jgi:hypothetical protein
VHHFYFQRLLQMLILGAKKKAILQASTFFSFFVGFLRRRSELLLHEDPGRSVPAHLLTRRFSRHRTSGPVNKTWCAVGTGRG